MSSLISDFLKRLFVPSLKAAETPALPEPATPAAKPREMTPERARLIEEAMSIYRQKQTLLSELTDVQREALTYIALKSFLGQLPTAPKKPPDKKA